MRRGGTLVGQAYLGLVLLGVVDRRVHLQEEGSTATLYMTKTKIETHHADMLLDLRVGLAKLVGGLLSALFHLLDTLQQFQFYNTHVNDNNKPTSTNRERTFVLIAQLGNVLHVFRELLEPFSHRCFLDGHLLRDI